MLGVRNYTQEYIDGCRSKVESDLSAYKHLVAMIMNQPTGDTSEPAIAAFEASFFNNMVLVLDRLFVHRLRTVEGKDGNPLNEVRVLCDSLVDNNAITSVDKSIKLSPEKSVLRYKVGDEIRLNEADFLLISTAFFAEMQKRYL